VTLRPCLQYSCACEAGVNADTNRQQISLVGH
jgi:hypothetical protein